MDSLAKQQKRGFYKVVLGYERLIQQNILKNFIHTDEIPTKRLELKEDNFKPGESFLNKLITFMAARSLVVIGDKAAVHSRDRINNFIFNKDSSVVGNFMSKMTHPIYYIFGHVTLSDYEKQMFALLIVHFAILFLGKKKEICNETYVSDFLSVAFNLTLLQGIDLQNRGKSRVQMYTEHFLAFLGNIQKSKAKDYLLKRKDNTDVYKKFIEMILNKKIAFHHLGEIIQYLIESKLGLLNQVALYTAGTLVTIFAYRGACRQIAHNMITIEVDRKNFNTLLDRVMMFTNKRIEPDEEYDIKDDTQFLSFKSFKIHNKVYTNANDVNSQMHFIIKDILKNIPQNVFVEKIEYWGYEDDEALKELPSSFDKNVNSKTKNDQKNDNVGSFDTHQILYSRKGKQQYNPKDLRSVDKEIIRYAKQHEKLYAFRNRKTFARKHLFNALSKYTKPNEISPKIPNTYIITFLNKNNDDNKFYFYSDDRPWLSHLQTMKATKNIKNTNKKSSLHDTYTVQLSITKFVDTNLENIMNDIPKPLHVLSVSRPSEEKNKSCKYYVVYNDTNPLQEDQCLIPKKMVTKLDTRIVNIVEKRNKRI